MFLGLFCALLKPLSTPLLCRLRAVFLLEKRMPAENWHLEKTVSVGHIVTTISVAVGVVLYISGIEQKVDTNTLEQAHIKNDLSRVERKVDTKVSKVAEEIKEMRVEQKQDNRRIEQKIDRLIERELNGR